MLASCGSKIEIENFQFAGNLKKTAESIFYVDMDSAITKGIEIPTSKQVKNGLLDFSFDYDYNGSEKLYYKIYFQNEDYKFSEAEQDSGSDLSNENFYGSWGETDFGFKELNAESEHLVDYTKICGNPRNERKFKGTHMSGYEITEQEVMDLCYWIKTYNIDWYNEIVAKAEKDKTPVEQQLYLNALYNLSYVRDTKGTANHRWKRNPRMGNYSAMLVVCTESDLNKIPDYIQDITLTYNDKYINPYKYFLHGDGKKLKNTKIVLNKKAITVASKIDITKGIYINRADQQNEQSFSYLNETCNNSSKLFRSAQVEQFFHAEIRDFKMNTIPVIADVLKNEYTLDDYMNAEQKYKNSQMISDYIRSSECPCKTVKLNPSEKCIEICNPKSISIATARKENVGIKTRVGYTYGKFTAKIKFPSQLNSTNVWTGLTNAFWLLFQDKQPWNNRRTSKTGYAQKGVYSPEAPRNPETYYSEIDFEMVKTSKFWPKKSYDDTLHAPGEDGKLNNDIIVTNTNFDLACKDPKRFDKGFCTTKYNGQEFAPFRWTPWHQAITIKTPVKNNELYDGEYYYYQVEWKPNEIIWRIGPDKKHLKVVGYMNDEITMIPNNQMVMIVTQEYHLTNWWPPMPFKQEFIPFLKNDLVGKIYEFEIE